MPGETLSPRDRIVKAAAQLLAEGGREAVSTRAISSAAGVQAPTIYRQFGDMQGLLDAVASYGFSSYLHAKRSQKRAADPVDDLRQGWDLHVEFGLANPALYALMYGDPTPGAAPAAAVEAAAMLRDLVQRVAEAGRLRVGVERAAQMIHAAGSGVTLALIAIRPEERDLALSEMTREAVVAAVTTDTPGAVAAPDGGRARAASHAVALKAVLPEVANTFTPAESGLLSDWLDRIAVSPTDR
jgi:AcrR family transcriptional regulator